MYGYTLDKKIDDFLNDIKRQPSEEHKLIIFPIDIKECKIVYHYKKVDNLISLSCTVYVGSCKSGCYSVIKGVDVLDRKVFDEKVYDFLRFFSSMGQNKFLFVYKTFCDFMSTGSHQND